MSRPCRSRPESAAGAGSGSGSGTGAGTGPPARRASARSPAARTPDEPAMGDDRPMWYVAPVAERIPDRRWDRRLACPLWPSRTRPADGTGRRCGDVLHSPSRPDAGGTPAPPSDGTTESGGRNSDQGQGQGSGSGAGAEAAPGPRPTRASARPRPPAPGSPPPGSRTQRQGQRCDSMRLRPGELPRTRRCRSPGLKPRPTPRRDATPPSPTRCRPPTGSCRDR